MLKTRLEEGKGIPAVNSAQRSYEIEICVDTESEMCGLFQIALIPILPANFSSLRAQYSAFINVCPIVSQLIDLYHVSISSDQSDKAHACSQWIVIISQLLQSDLISFRERNLEACTRQTSGIHMVTMHNGFGGRNRVTGAVG